MDETPIAPTHADQQGLSARPPGPFVGSAKVKSDDGSPPQPFGDYLKSRMNECGLSAVALSAATTDAPGGPVAASTISNLRNGNVRPGYDVLRKLAPALNVGLARLLVAAGLATEAELGLSSGPPLPPQFQHVLDYARTRQLSAREQNALFGIVGRSPLIFEEAMAAVAQTAPREPRMTSKVRSGAPS